MMVTKMAGISWKQSAKKPGKESRVALPAKNTPPIELKDEMSNLMNQALADEMVEKAVLFCADKKFTGDKEVAYEALHNGRCDACDFLSFSLVRQIAEYLGRVDKTVRAVYMFRPDNAPISLSAGRTRPRKRASGMNLVAWVDRKTPALWPWGLPWKM
jgi:hypothetical protein